MTPGGANEARTVRLFVSYSHENATWFRLLPVLRVKANVHPLQPWHDTELKAGDRWDKEIRDELDRINIFLCLVSYQFLAFGYKVRLVYIKICVTTMSHLTAKLERMGVTDQPRGDAGANARNPNCACPSGNPLLTSHSGECLAL